jgi:ABC-type transporter Mla MlaB component
MTLRIHPQSDAHGTRLSLSGELRRAHLVDLRSEIEVWRATALDLDEINVADIDGIRLLNACEEQGIQLINCSPYIREWMLQERQALPDDE